MNLNNYSLFNCRTCKRHFTSIKNLNDHKQNCWNSGDISIKKEYDSTDSPSGAKESANEQTDVTWDNVNYQSENIKEIVENASDQKSIECKPCQLKLLDQHTYNNHENMHLILKKSST